jgi:hypothetical protein
MQLLKLQAKRHADSLSDAMSESQNGSKRARSSHSEYSFERSTEETVSHRSAYELTPPQHCPSIKTYRGTVLSYQVEGLRMVFDSPETGPGYYVVLCYEPDGPLDENNGSAVDPWARNNARRHYKKALDCHHGEHFTEDVVTDEMIIQRFGYLGRLLFLSPDPPRTCHKTYTVAVEDMTERNYLTSNRKLEDKRVANEFKKKANEVGKKTTATKKGRTKPDTTHHAGHANFRIIDRQPPAAEQAPFPIMGPPDFRYSQPTCEDDVDQVRSDLL